MGRVSRHRDSDCIVTNLQPTPLALAAGRVYDGGMTNTTRPTTKQHTCGGPVFGRKTPGCPRCDELIAGAAPVVWKWTSRKAEDAQRCRELAEHFASARHRAGRCGTCTFGEW
jgi:hypothetical protein